MSDDPVLAALARLEAGQASLRGDLTLLRVELMERMDRLQHSVDLVKDDVTVNYGSGDRVERLARSATDETRALAEVVRAMQRQIGKLRTDLEQLRDGRGS
jgi:hypothetical protein